MGPHTHAFRISDRSSLTSPRHFPGSRGSLVEHAWVPNGGHGPPPYVLWTPAAAPTGAPLPERPSAHCTGPKTAPFSSPLAGPQSPLNRHLHLSPGGRSPPGAPSHLPAQRPGLRSRSFWKPSRTDLKGGPPRPHHSCDRPLEECRPPDPCRGPACRPEQEDRVLFLLGSF